MNATLELAAPARTATPNAPRFDLYGGIHKALRHFMTDTLLRVGHIDSQDDEDLGHTLAQLDALLHEMRSHLHRENQFIHPAIEARCAGAARRIATEHEEHDQAIDALQAEAAALAAAATDQRALLAARLYRHLALFVADNLQHMHIEESAHNQTLWMHYSDAELMAIHGAILANVSPAEMAQVMHWMAPALSHAELAGIMAGMQADAPPPAFDAMLSLVQSRLPTPRWDKLALALHLPQQPGLVHSR